MLSYNYIKLLFSYALLNPNESNSHITMILPASFKSH